MFNRKLKQEIMEKTSEILRLEREVSELKRFREDAAKISIENEKLVREFNELVKKERVQNEADLFFISAKIQKKLLDGEPKENVSNLYSAQNYFQGQLQALSGAYQMPYYSQQAGLFGQMFR